MNSRGISADWIAERLRIDKQTITAIPGKTTALTNSPKGNLFRKFIIQGGILV